jgi:CO/xanthine dehydrogenase Mo-binding subunit
MTLRGRVAEIAAADLNVRPGALEFAGGRIFASANPDNHVPLSRTAARAHWSPLSIPEGAGAGLRETATWTLPSLTEPDSSDRVNSSGAYGFIFDFCGVEIDPDTGAIEIPRYASIDDAGQAINPLILHGQVHGGIAQGVGQALLEDVVYADGTGQVLSGSFMDYGMPRAHHLPSFDIALTEDPTKGNPLRVKGGGEAGITPALAVVMNAVMDALKDYGIEHIDMPATPHRIWAAIQAAKRAS